LVDARGSYVLNGNFIVSAFHKELHVSGTILEYSGSGTVVERINGTGMIYEDIYVHVCSVVGSTLSNRLLVFTRTTLRVSAVLAMETWLAGSMSYADIVSKRLNLS